MLGNKAVVTAGLLAAASIALLAVRGLCLEDEPKRAIERGARHAVAKSGVVQPVVQPDTPKAVIESPLKSVVNKSGEVTPNGGVPVAKTRPMPVLTASTPPARRPDVGKGYIEIPTEVVLAFKTATAGAKAPSSPADANPKVEPGKVRWHKSLAEACEAAKRSGKPVLLFHLLGKLDDQFC